MSKARATTEQETLRTCTTRALDALAALKEATKSLDRLPAPRDATEQDLHDEIANRLKRVHCEIMAVVFATSMVVDSLVPQVPNVH